MYTYDFEELAGFPKILIDKISNQNESVATRFAHIDSAYSHDRLAKIANKFPDRSKLIQTIQDSFYDMPLSPAQSANLNKLGDSSSVAIVTGQQVGFMGGPLYTLFKAISSVKISNELDAKFPDISSVPVFWIEDNDRDVLEACRVFMYDKNYEPHELILPHSGKNKAPVEELVISDSVNELLDKIESLLPETQFKQMSIGFLRKVYTPGKGLTQAFVTIMNELLGYFGVLFLSASKARKNGLFLDNVINEINFAPGFYESIQKANNVLIESGYEAKAKAWDVNLFYIEDGSGSSVEFNRETNKVIIAGISYSKEEAANFVYNHTSSFAPKVLSRPIFQDSILPCAAYVGGPGELAYYAQLKEAYEAMGLETPYFENRVSLGFVDKKALRFFEKNELNPKYFIRDYSLIEKEITAKLSDEAANKVFDEAELELKNIYEKIKPIAEAAEVSMLRTADANLFKSLELINALRKKVDSANKKKHEEAFVKYKQIANFLYPNKTHQERYYSPLNFINAAGPEYFVNKLNEIFDLDRTKFTFLEF